MNPSFYLNWQTGPNTLIGIENDIFVENSAVHGISFPNKNTDPLPISLSSNARQLQTFDTLTNVKLYLVGDPDQINTLQVIWPSLGGGLQISFDGGRTYNTFSTTYGYQTNSSTWILLPAESIGLNGIDGILGAFDSANFLLKYSIPEQATQYQIYNISLTADWDTR